MALSHEVRHKIFQVGIMILVVGGALGGFLWLLTVVGFIKMSPNLAFGIAVSIVALGLILIFCGETEEQSHADRMRVPGDVVMDE